MWPTVNTAVGWTNDPRLRVLAPLGRGGMSDVWLAALRGPAGFEKLVAVKQLRMSDEVDRGAAFLHEARLAARLNHPNIVQTFEILAQGGNYRIVMEFLEGQPLNKVLHRAAGRIELRDLARVLVDVLAGLHHAHELADRDGRPSNVVHRDVSPHNVFVTWEGGVKLLDFGVARFGREHTDDGLIKGKLTYMSPEQALSRPVDRRADLFAAGVMLWEFVAGRRMWAGLTDHQLYRELVAGRIPELVSHAPSAPPELVEVCARALAPDRGRRFATADEMRHAVEGWLARAGSPSPRRMGEWVSDLFAADRERLRAIVAQGAPDEEVLDPTVLGGPVRATPGAPAPRVVESERSDPTLLPSDLATEPRRGASWA
ncbi:MAG: serine/threonine-protein kinase, partial [Myxococcota bacterium]